MVEDGLTGFLVAPHDGSTLAERLAFLLGDPEAARRMGGAGRQRVELRFPFEAMLERVESELLEALAQGTDLPWH